MIDESAIEEGPQIDTDYDGYSRIQKKPDPQLSVSRRSGIRANPWQAPFVVPPISDPMPGMSHVNIL